MADVRRDPRAGIDPAINSPGREGLTGTAPASLYTPSFDREQITIAPDFASPEAQPAWRQIFRSTVSRLQDSSRFLSSRQERTDDGAAPCVLAAAQSAKPAWDSNWRDSRQAAEIEEVATAYRCSLPGARTQ